MSKVVQQLLAEVSGLLDVEFSFCGPSGIRHYKKLSDWYGRAFAACFEPSNAVQPDNDDRHVAKRQHRKHADQLQQLLHLARFVGIVECNLEDMAERIESAHKTAATRLSGDMGDSPPAIQKRAAHEAHTLRESGSRNFRKVIAERYEVDTKTVGRWMKRFPPSTRT